jgi:formylglycine-generating enzyme required for sulfatase activity
MVFTSYDGSATTLLFDTDALGYATFSDEVLPSATEPGIYRTDYALYVNQQYNGAGTISAKFPTGDTDQNGITDFLQKNKQGNASVSGKIIRQLPSVGPEIAISGEIARSAGTSQGTYSLTGRDPVLGNITYQGNLFLVNLLGKLKYNRTNRTVTIEADLEREGGVVIKCTSVLDYSIADGNTISFPAGKLTSPNQPDAFIKAFVLKRTGNRYMSRLDFVDAYRGTSWPDYTAWQVEIVDVNDSDGDGVPDLSDPPVVQSPPTISVQPVSQTRTVGEAVALTVQASGSGVLFYSWQKNGMPVLNIDGVSGASGPTLSFASIQTSQAGDYSVVVSNLVGSVVSAIAQVTINPPKVTPTIVGQPQPVTAQTGQMAVFTVVATGTEPLAYQWKRNGVNLPGATASTLTINQPQSSDAGDYSVEVSNSVGSVSSAPAKLTVDGGPVSNAAQAVAVIRGGLVASITITDGSIGYTKEPNVTMSGGDGTGATAKAFIENGRVVAIVILSSGSGYTVAPTVTIDAPSKSVGLRIELIPKLTVEGPVGQNALVEWATELIGPWTAWSNVVVGAEGTVLVDLTPGSERRFYRAVADPRPVGPTGFVWVPPGSFVMGSPVSEPYQGGDEIQHPVTLTQGFWLSDHEVTQGEYQSVMGINPSRFTGDSNRPVEMVDWNMAVGYCQKLTERERAAGRITAQQAYRLPTEAEWEYAARAGTTGQRYGELDAIAWWSGNSGGQTHPVKQMGANAWGLHDMIGNVWEWCSDWYGPYPTGSVTDPTGPSSGPGRVLRGGCWLSSAATRVRSAGRHALGPNSRADELSFRPALSSVR